MSSPPASLEERLAAFLERTGCAGAGVERLVQDAGERVYFRVRPPGGAALPVDPPGSGHRTFVACVMSGPYSPGSLPFADSAALYRRLGVRAPELGVEAPDLGALALEDLGDELLQTAALAGDPQTPALYREAVSILGVIQREGASVGAAAEAARYRAFSMHLDEALFVRELRFFLEHFADPRSDRAARDVDQAALDRALVELAAEAASFPTALCHRDYHSRNLIAHPGSAGGALSVIDHQDTRLGPRLYDFVSLARDPYVAAGPGGRRHPVSEAELLEGFCEATGLEGSSGEELQWELDAVALQRGLKALGTYGFQVHRRRNPVYRSFIAPTLAAVRENLDRWPARRRLGSLLGELLDETGSAGA